ncbi:hypothetical protein [Tritonibacter mobilis]|uniref:hypothetical protein n=1 Tax=Tritonibacter mobilis TaxID=379347 RepID=UPI0003270F1F|nr:hypothetical protein [Tritonibacter mobilis]
MGQKKSEYGKLNTGYEVPEALFDAVVRVHKEEVPFGARELWYDVLAHEHPILVRALHKAYSTRPETNE